MKEIEDGWVKIKKYTDDDGKPVCGGCPLWATRGFFCGGWSDEGEHEESYPGPSCPIWHGERKNESPACKCECDELREKVRSKLRFCRVCGGDALKEITECLNLLKEARLCLETWKDVAPAVSLCADIDKFLQENKP